MREDKWVDKVLKKIGKLHKELTNGLKRDDGTNPHITAYNDEIYRLNEQLLEMERNFESRKQSYRIGKVNKEIKEVL